MNEKPTRARMRFEQPFSLASRLNPFLCAASRSSSPKFVIVVWAVSLPSEPPLLSLEVLEELWPKAVFHKWRIESIDLTLAHEPFDAKALALMSSRT